VLFLPEDADTSQQHNRRGEERDQPHRGTMAAGPGGRVFPGAIVDSPLYKAGRAPRSRVDAHSKRTGDPSMAARRGVPRSAAARSSALDQRGGEMARNGLVGRAGNRPRSLGALAVALASGCCGMVCLSILVDVTYSRCPAFNTRDADHFREPEPPGFVRQKPDAPGLLAFRRYLGDLIRPPARVRAVASRMSTLALYSAPG
jgi:hypothetical protein